MSLILSLGTIYSQQVRIDSLKLQLSNGAGANKYDLLINLVRIYASTNSSSDYKIALKYAITANQYAYKSSDSTKIVNSSRMMAQLYNTLSNNKEAQRILLRCIPIAKRNGLMNEYKTMLSNLAIAYTYQAKYDLALL